MQPGRGQPAFWFVFIGRAARFGFFATLESISYPRAVCLADLPRVIGFYATLRSGGHIRYVGGGATGS